MKTECVVAWFLIVTYFISTSFCLTHLASASQRCEQTYVWGRANSFKFALVRNITQDRAGRRALRVFANEVHFLIVNEAHFLYDNEAVF